MKLMIAYDGSKHADIAIDDLPRAGFPIDSEVLVATVADFSDRRPTPSEFSLLSAASTRVDAVLAQARQHEARVLQKTRSMSLKLAQKLRLQFPKWKVHTEVLRGRPADRLLRKAAEWKPDLIMGGSHGRSAIGRFFLGSVSKSGAEKATSSVRIVRRGLEKAPGDPIEIILGAKSPAEAEQMVETVGRRVWPAGTRIRLVAIDNNTAAFYSDGRTVYECAAERLAADGARVSVQFESGDAKTLLLKAADDWKADAIFVVAGSSSGRRKLDETAAGLITSAKSTIEIVR